MFLSSFAPRDKSQLSQTKFVNASVSLLIKTVARSLVGVAHPMFHPSISFTLLRKQTRVFRLSDLYLPPIPAATESSYSSVECDFYGSPHSNALTAMFQYLGEILSCLVTLGSLWSARARARAHFFPGDCLCNNLNTVPNITFRERWATPYGTKCRHEWGRGAAHIGGLHVSNFIGPHSDTRLSFILLPINYCTLTSSL